MSKENVKWNLELMLIIQKVNDCTLVLYFE
jgi:hypothetical protein